MRLACLGAGVSLSLQSVAAPLDIQRLSVQSVRGEPLRAVAVIRTESSEQIAPECLSLGDESDLPSPDYPLLRNARIMLSAAGDAVEISTVEPVTSPGVAVVLRVQCPGEPLTARHFNFLIRQPWDPVQTHTAESAGAHGRGTRLTVLHDETVASIARSIYPSNTAARRQLEQAIVAANPDLFPRGKLVRLKAGTRLVVPDLRDAKEIAAAAAQVRAPPAQPSPSQIAAPAAASRPLEGEDISAGTQAIVEPRLPKRLKLKLTRADLNLKRSEGISEAKREELRRLYRGEVVTVAAAGTEALELKIAQLRESQGVINTQLARLEQAVESLRRSIAAVASTMPATPPPLPPRPAPQPIAISQQAPWMLWAAAAAGALLLAAIAFLLGRRARPAGGPVDEHEARIDALLQQARAVAGPLLQPEAETPRPAARKPPPPPPVAEPSPPAAAQEAPEEVSPLPELPDFLLESQGKVSGSVDLELETEPTTAQQPAEQVGVKTDLKREMDLALDNSRSMFTDVDRFISLGRTQNAISLLEFQVHKDPNDRDSWVKLMAVYRQEGMEAEFQRTFAEFKRKFPGEV